MTENEEKREMAVTAIDGSVHMLDVDALLSVKDLAYYLGKSESFIYAMIKSGFSMPRDAVRRYRVASYISAIQWLESHADFTFDKVYRKPND